MRTTWILLAVVTACKTADTASVKDAATSTSPILSLNDVSIAFPVTSTADLALFPKSGETGPKGVLLPPAVVQRAAQDDKGPADTASTIFLDPKVLVPTAVRFDPCAPMMSTDESKCLKQMRVVWQRADDGKSSQINGKKVQGFEDEAIHGIYNLTPVEFAAAVQTIANLKSAAGGTNYDNQPLGLHPLVVQQGLSGAFAQGIFALIRQYAGASNMTQMSYLTVQTEELLWDFGGLDIINGQPVLHNVPTLPVGNSFQEITIDPSAGNQVTSVAPFQPGESVVDAAAAYTDSGAKAITQPMYNELMRIENPQLVNIGMTDCGSCHLASPLAASVTTEAQNKALPAAASNVFVSTWNLANPNGHDMTDLDLHNFSYINGGFSVSQRVINESALCADYINQNVLGSP